MSIPPAPANNEIARFMCRNGIRFWNIAGHSIIIELMSPSGDRSTYANRQKQIIAAVVSARKDAGVSQAELAAAIGLNQSDISKIETGERRLDVVEFLQLADYLSHRTGKRDLLDSLIAACRVDNVQHD
jgi:DNA-binding XRE family transcriptional regulator